MSQVAEKGIPGLREAMESDMRAMEINQKDMAQHFGLSQQAISSWISNGRVPFNRIKDVLSFFLPESKTAAVLSGWLMNKLDANTEEGAAKHQLAKRVIRPQGGISALGAAAQEAFAEALAAGRISDQQLLRYIAEWKGLPVTAE